jgi:hypothetical protein
MKFKAATKKYESWLASQIPVIEEDLELKHKEMKKEIFPFLRATFYRWAQLWPKICKALSKSPQVLAVGDLHVENFGTWRDIEGRLIWGINDFDEAYTMAYTIDLVRLATSADLAIKAGHLAIQIKDACKAILTGYQEAIKIGGGQFVLEENRKWLRNLAMNELRVPAKYWEKMQALPILTDSIASEALEALEKQMPEPGIKYRLVKRVAGLGSLGRHRYVAIADWRGGKIARETKPLLPSAYCWANDIDCKEIMYQRLLDQAIRCPDPFVKLQGNWIVRRLAPHCSRIELASLPKERDEVKLLSAMGWETANIHLGTVGAKEAISEDLEKRNRNQGWLHEAVKDMSKATEDDWKEWKED